MKDIIAIMMVIIAVFILYVSVGFLIVSVVLFEPIIIAESLIGAALSTKFLMWYID